MHQEVLAITVTQNHPVPTIQAMERVIGVVTVDITEMEIPASTIHKHVVLVNMLMEILVKIASQHQHIVTIPRLDRVAGHVIQTIILPVAYVCQIHKTVV